MGPARLALALFSFACLLLDAAEIHPQLNIKVLLKKTSEPVEISTNDGRLFWKADDRGEWIALMPQARISLDRKNDQIRIGTSTSLYGTVFLRAQEGGDATWELEGKKLRGTLQITKKGNQLLLISKTPLESYTEGVVAAEMGNRAEFEALKAQAVAARTFAFHRQQNPRNAMYDVEASIHDQVFGQVSGDSSKNSLVKAAVKATQGQYLYYDEPAKGHQLPPPFKAFFHSRCGGNTATAKDIWINAEGNHAPSVTCQYCQKNHYRWTARVPLNEFTEALKLPLESVTLNATKRDADGRLIELTTASSGKTTKWRAEEFRRRLGFTRLQSTNFTWTALPSEIQFTGNGAGHGVGMCQWGARGMARQGKGYEEILLHYYGGSRLFRPTFRVSSLGSRKSG